MSYYSSNQPYNSAYQQKDGVANGAIVGGLMGGAAMGGFHASGDYVKKKLAKHDASGVTSRAVMNGIDLSPDEMKNVGALGDNPTKTGKAFRTADKLHGKAFGGGWKGKLAAYGGSALTGMVGGAGIDAMSNSNK